jgi:hypothetical protein
MFPANAKAAQTVQDGCGEASGFAELRVDVKRVEIAGETVQSGLFLCRLFFHDFVWVALRRFMCLCRGAAVAALLLAAEVSGAADKYRTLIVEYFLPRLGVLCYGAVYDEASRALVDNFHELGYRDQLGFGRDGELADFQVLFAVQQHAWVEVRYDIVEREGGFGVEWGYDTECGYDLEVLVAFVDEGEVGAFGTNSEVCNDMS